MSIFTITGSIFTSRVSLNICRRHQEYIGKFCQTKSLLRHSFKTSHWNQSRWPGRKQQTFQKDEFAPRLWKPFAFTIAVSGISIAGSAIWKYENVRSQAFWASKWSSVSPKYGHLRRHMHSWWHNLSSGEKIFYPICGVNFLVYLAWWVPAWKPIMWLYFTCSPTAKAVCWPMLFSVFSHYNIVHLGANMVALYSFSRTSVEVMGKEQFLGFYLTAGVVASFASYLFKTLTRSSAPSLGASGAVMGLIGYVCMRYPESKIAVIFLPQFHFDAGAGLKTIMAIDTIGCIMRWKILDHAGHLGGSLFGIFWILWGHDLIWKNREPLVAAWHKFRGPVR